MSQSRPSSLRQAPEIVSTRMGITSIRRGREIAPDREFVIGTEGIGKSTFGSEAPNPVFIAAEDGLRYLDVAKFPQPENFADVLAAVDELRTSDHDFKTVVFDTVDWLEPLITAEICRREGWNNIEAPGYGKGFNLIPGEYRKLLLALERLRAVKPMEVIFLAHSTVKTFSNPVGDDFSRYEAALSKQGYAVLRAWCDSVLFLTHEEFTNKETPKSRAKGVSTGRRVIHTERTAAWDAKNRYELPPTLPLSYADYAAARQEFFDRGGSAADPVALLAECSALVERMELPADAPIRAYLAENKANASKLIKALNRLRVKANENE